MRLRGLFFNTVANRLFVRNSLQAGFPNGGHAHAEPMTQKSHGLRHDCVDRPDIHFLYPINFLEARILSLLFFKSTLNDI